MSLNLFITENHISTSQTATYVADAYIFKAYFGIIALNR